jgi:hypothetical protein
MVLILHGRWPSRQKYREGADSHNVDIIVNGSA